MGQHTDESIVLYDKRDFAVMKVTTVDPKIWGLFWIMQVSPV